MTQIIDAIYEHGTFRPIAPPTLALSEGQQVRLVVEATTADDVLSLAFQVYAGLSEQDVNEVETIALDRSAFFPGPTD
jgi:predicted DNA-binding antitoxin AbrB/MazE fold protein